MTTRATWHILTGEYPPRPGGVGDYSALLALGLVETGAEVHVWTSSDGLASPSGPDGLTVHRDCGGWSSDDLVRLGTALDAFPGPRHLVVQHAPNVWRYKGLNFAFGRWLVGRRRDRGDVTRVMFHEVAYPFEPFGKPTRWVLAAGQRLMARTIMSASAYVDVSTPAWVPTLRRCAPGVRREIGWRPVPSNIPVLDDPESVEMTRRQHAPGGETVVGCFGSFTFRGGEMLARILPSLLRDRPDRIGLLIGHAGDRLAARLIAEHPDLAARIHATGGLDPAGISRHLQACDVVVQPYPEGVTTRRGSMMAALAHGLATVTNAGRLTEPFWAEARGVALAAGPSVDELVNTAERVLGDPRERGWLSAAGLELYNSRFAISWTIKAILDETRQQVTT